MIRMLAVCLTALLPALAAAERTVGALDTPGFAQSLTLVGDRVYLADGDRGLRIIDVSQPAAPRHLGSFDTPGTEVPNEDGTETMSYTGTYTCEPE